MSDTDTSATEFLDDFNGRIRQLIPEVHDFIPLHEPHIATEAESYVLDCLRSGWVSSVGPLVVEFEERVRNRVGSSFAIATVNGTAALHLALLALGVEPGDEVILPSLTFVATGNAVSYCGAVPHFVDVETQGMGLCPVALRERLIQVGDRRDGSLYNRETGRKISVVICMHALGHSAQLSELRAVCDEFGLALCEDAAEAFGTLYRDHHVGTVGKVAILSFNGNKILTTGLGGMVVTNCSELAQRVRHLSTTAKMSHPWLFIHDQVGFNYRLSSLNAALGCAGLDEFDQVLEAKRSLAAFYEQAFSGSQFLQFVRAPAYSLSNFWLNAVKLCPEYKKHRDDLLAFGHQEGFMLRPFWTPLDRLPMYLDSPKGPLTHTTDLFDRIVCLPSSANLSLRTEELRRFP